MKRIISIFLLVILLTATAVVSVSAETLSDVLKSDEFKEAIATSDIGNAVKVSTDIQVKKSDETYGEVYANADVSSDMAFIFKADIDMSGVRNKFAQYIRYSEALFVGKPAMLDELKYVNIMGKFEVKMVWPKRLGDKISEDIKTPPEDMYGFSFTAGTPGQINGLDITDVYTEIDPANPPAGIQRQFDYDEETEEYTLIITIYTKSPTQAIYSPLKAGDLMVGVADPYAALDVESYLSDITLEFKAADEIAFDFAEIQPGFIETVHGIISGNTKFEYEDILITDVTYTSKQKTGGEDTLYQTKPADLDSEIKSKNISSTIELKETGAFKITFHIDGKYLKAPAVSGKDYTGHIAPIYSSSPYSFVPSEHNEISDVKAGYTFKGWSLTNGGTVISNTEEFSADTDLYAVFKKDTTQGGSTEPVKEIILSFVVDGDSKLISPITSTRPTNIDLSTVVVPEKEGFVFDGWYTDAAYINKADKNYYSLISSVLYGRYVRIEAPDILNSDVHFAYVIGYPEGDVRPENNITREEVTTIFYRLLKASVRDAFFTDKNKFSDVEIDRWSNKAISTMANGKFILGYNDGTFKPGNFITRAEFVTIASRLLPDSTNIRTNFTDIKGHWAERYIGIAAGNGWINGYEDGSFKPENYITRAEAMAIINRILVRYVNESGLHKDAKQWPDNPKDMWYYYDVLEATNAHDFVRQDDKIHENWTSINENNVWADKPEYEDAN